MLEAKWLKFWSIWFAIKIEKRKNWNQMLPCVDWLWLLFRHLLYLAPKPFNFIYFLSDFIFLHVDLYFVHGFIILFSCFLLEYSYFFCIYILFRKFNHWIGVLRSIVDMHVVLLYTKFYFFQKYSFKNFNPKLIQTMFEHFFYDQILIFSFLETFSAFL